jgi:hypothetical protein
MVFLSLTTSETKVKNWEVLFATWAIFSHASKLTLVLEAYSHTNKNGPRGGHRTLISAFTGRRFSQVKLPKGHENLTRCEKRGIKDVTWRRLPLRSRALTEISMPVRPELKHYKTIKAALAKATAEERTITASDLSKLTGMPMQAKTTSMILDRIMWEEVALYERPVTICAYVDAKTLFPKERWFAQLASLGVQVEDRERYYRRCWALACS